MCALRILFVLGIMVSSAQAGQSDLTQRFAQCVGRMSAEMEFAWLKGESGDQARLFRANLEAVLGAVAEPNSGKQILNWRIEAKHAHSSLLTRSMFNDDQRDAVHAARTAERYAQSCRSMLLG